jgi:hypothetical protein
MTSARLSLTAALERIRVLERELAALRAVIAAPDCGSSYVSRLLTDELLRTTRLRVWQERNPFGSTGARETLAEARLPNEVTIDAEDVETLPRRVPLKLQKDGSHFHATARLRSDDGSSILYAIA